MSDRNGPAVPKYPSDRPVGSLLSVVAARAEAVPRRVFVRDVGGSTATYEDAFARGSLWCEALRDLGLQGGDRVLTMVPNSVEAVVLWLGIASAGGIEAPVHLAYKGSTLAHAITAIQPRVIVATEDALGELCKVLEGGVTVEKVIVVGPTIGPVPKVAGSDVLVANEILERTSSRGFWHLPAFHETAVLLLTSGTTGRSKPVIVPWGQLQATAQGSFFYDDLDCDDVIYTYTPWSHVGSRAHVYLAGLIGGADVLRPAFSTDEFLSDIRRFGITSAALLGAMAHFLTALPASPDDADISLRNVVMLPLLPDMDRFKQRFGVRVYTGFGMTELAIPIRGKAWSTANPAAAGYAWDGWPHFEMRLVDQHDEEVEVGAIGELIVRSAVPWTISPGYYGMPEATAASWRNGWFHTGDLFRQDADGAYYFVDRAKDCIRRRGENISSFEVEAAALQHPAVADAAAVAAPSQFSEDEVRLFVVLKPHCTLPAMELHGFLQDQLPRFMVPRYLDVVDSLPKTATLRTQKHELRSTPMTDRTWDHLRSVSVQRGDAPRDRSHAGPDGADVCGRPA